MYCKDTISVCTVKYISCIRYKYLYCKDTSVCTAKIQLQYLYCKDTSTFTVKIQVHVLYRYKYL